MNAPVLSADILWDANPCPMLVLLADNSIVRLNSAAEMLLARSRSTITGAGLVEVVETSQALINLIEWARREVHPVSENRLPLRIRGRRQEVQADTQIVPLDEGGGAVMMLVQPLSPAVLLDRRDARTGALRSVQALSAALAHEVKNPLAAIHGAAQLIHDITSGENAELAGLIKQETMRISRLINRFEHFTDTRPIECKPVNIHHVLERAREAAEVSFAQKITFTPEFDPSLPPALGDEDLLIQAFQNLIRNAAEAMGGGGKITLSTRFRSGIRISDRQVSGRRISLPLEICLSDNGPGIEPDLQPLIFDPFVTTKSTGGGLGLAIVSKIVSDHQGLISCQSDAGGTCFEILLPVYEDDPY